MIDRLITRACAENDDRFFHVILFFKILNTLADIANKDSFAKAYFPMAKLKKLFQLLEEYFELYKEVVLKTKQGRMGKLNRSVKSCLT